LVLVAQELSKIGGYEDDPTISGDEDKCGLEIKRSDIWARYDLFGAAERRDAAKSD
jgi:hypothetical protein